MFAKSPKIKWKTVPFTKANKAYSISKATQGALDPVEHDMGWPDEEPSFRVFEGDVVANGGASFGAEDEEDCTAFVVTGDLKVDGPLIAFQGDVQGVLFVMGSVTCTDCLVAMEGQLVIGGSLSVARTLATSMGQMGALCIGGNLSATDWAETTATGLLWLGTGKPNARIIDALESGDWPPSYRTEGSSAIDYGGAVKGEIVAGKHVPWDIRDAMLKGKPVVEVR